MTIAPAVDPNTGYDPLSTSKTGATYSVLTNADFDSPVDTWSVLEVDLAPNPPQISYNVSADGERRFYVIKETPANRYQIHGYSGETRVRQSSSRQDGSYQTRVQP
jgi:hypothetical protein